MATHGEASDGLQEAAMDNSSVFCLSAPRLFLLLEFTCARLGLKFGNICECLEQ